MLAMEITEIPYADRFSCAVLNQTVANVPELLSLSFHSLFPLYPSSHTFPHSSAHPAPGLPSSSSLCLFSFHPIHPEHLQTAAHSLPRFPHYITLFTPNIEAPDQEASAHAFIISDQKTSLPSVVERVKSSFIANICINHCCVPLCTSMVTSLPRGHLLNRSTTWLWLMFWTFLLLTSIRMSPSFRPRQRG